VTEKFDIQGVKMDTTEWHPSDVYDFENRGAEDIYTAEADA
jgi:hypothetical protein